MQLFQAFQQATSGNNSALSATAGGNKSQSAPSSAGNGNNINSSLNNRNDSADKNETVAPLALWAPGGGVGDGDKDSGNPGGGGSGGGGSPQHEIIPFHQDFRPAAAGAGANNSSSGNNSNSNAGAIYNNNSNNQQYMSNAAVPVKSQPLNNNNSASASGGNNYNGVNPIRFTGPASPRGNNITINNTNNMHGYNETGTNSLENCFYFSSAHFVCIFYKINLLFLILFLLSLQVTIAPMMRK